MQSVIPRRIVAVTVLFLILLTQAPSVNATAEPTSAEPPGIPPPEPESTAEGKGQPPDPEPESAALMQTVTFVFLYVVCMLLIIFGNILVVVIVLKSVELRNNTSNLQLLSLVTARAAIGVFVVPAGIASMFSEKELGGTFCRICHYCATASGAASIFSIIAIAIVKYRSVVLNHPPNMSLKRSIMAILLIWASSFVYAIRTPIIYDLVIVNVNHTQFYSCTVSPDYKTMNSIFMIVDAVCLFAFPLFTITFCYAHVMKKLAQTVIKMDNDLKSTTTKAIKMLAILITLFTLCTLPPYALKIYVNWIAGPFKGMNTVMLSVNLFSYSNGWFNLIVFAVYRDDLRRGFKQLTCLRRCYKRVSPTKTVSSPDWTEIRTEHGFPEKGDKTVIVDRFDKDEETKHENKQKREAMLMMEF